MNQLKLIACALLLSVISCQDVKLEDELNDVVPTAEFGSNGSSTASVQVMAGLKLMHGGCIIPAGFCFTKPIGNPKPKPPKPLWSIAQEEEGWASAYLSIEGDYMKIIPLRKAHDEEGIVPVTDDILVDSEISEELGFTDIIISAGEYEINMDVENEWGEFYVPVSLTIKDDII